MNIEQLQQENADLKQENLSLNNYLAELQEEHILVIKTIIRTLNSIGLWPIKTGDNLVSKAMKEVPKIIMQSTVNPKALEERFSFMKDIFPLCEKYADIDIKM